MTKEILEQILQLSKEKQIPEKQACIEILGKEIKLSEYKRKFGIEVNKIGKAEFTARRQREHDVDDTYFSEINEVNSYYAGFIAADGNINKDHPNLTIGLSSKDREFLEKFNINMSSTYSIKDRYSNGFPYVSLTVTSEQICKDLYENFNICPNKSLIYIPKDLEQPYKDCFIMGLIDGDGSIGFSARKEKQPSLYISLVGTKDSVQYVKERFEEILGKETSNLFQREKNKNYYSYRISDRNARIIFSYFYERYNYLPTLDRKWTKEIYEYCKSWKKSEAPSRQKGVNVFDLQGNLIKTCKTLKEAEEFTGAASSTISKCCKEDNNKHQSNGFMFSRTKNKMDPYNNTTLNMKHYLNRYKMNIEDNA